jgi:subtilase family serine protease
MTYTKLTITTIFLGFLTVTIGCNISIYVSAASFNNNSSFIVSKRSPNLVLDIVNASEDTGAKIILWNKKTVSKTSNTLNQRWKQPAQSYNTIKGMNNKCLDSGDSESNVVRIKDCTGETNQNWLITGDNRLKSQSDNTLCMDVDPTGVTRGSLLMMNKCNNYGNQFWTID